MKDLYGNMCYLSFLRFGNRKQFLLADGKIIYAFVANGQKFSNCNTFIDKTCDVKCKVFKLL